MPKEPELKEPSITEITKLVDKYFWELLDDSSKNKRSEFLMGLHGNGLDKF